MTKANQGPQHVDVMSYESTRQKAAAHAYDQQQPPHRYNGRRLLAAALCLVAAAFLSASYYQPHLRVAAVVVVILAGGIVFHLWPRGKGLPLGPVSRRQSPRASAQRPRNSGRGSAVWPPAAARAQQNQGSLMPPQGTAAGGNPGQRQDPYQDAYPNAQQQALPGSNPNSNPNPATQPPLGPGPLRPLVFIRPSAFGAADWRLPRLLAQPGAAADQAQVGDLAIRAASVIGRGHRHPERAKPRQDAYQLGTVRCADRGFVLAAVADGTSSADHADLGASIAAVGAVGFLTHRLSAGASRDEQLLAEMFKWLADTICRIAVQDQKPPAAYTTTLLVAMVPDAPTHSDGSREVLLGWVGDSPAWVFTRDGWLQATGQAKQGMDQNKLEACLPGLAQRFQYKAIQLPAGTALALMSDGLGDALANVSSSQKELAQRWATPPSLPEFLRDLDLDAPGQDDDRTAVILWCPPGRQAAP